MSRETRVSVPVSDQLLHELRERPSTFGVASLTSEASRLRALIEAGAAAERRRVAEQAMALAYDEWSYDEESREATAGLADILLGDEGFVGSLLEQPKPLKR